MVRFTPIMIVFVIAIIIVFIVLVGIVRDSFEGGVGRGFCVEFMGAIYDNFYTESLLTDLFTGDGGYYLSRDRFTKAKCAKINW